MKPGATTPVFRVALYEGVGAQSLPGAHRAELLQSLLEKGYAVTCIRPGAAVTHSTEGRLLVLGLFTESKPLEAQDDTGKITLHFRPIDNLDVAQTAALVDQVRDEWKLPKPGSWKPWFPVIDYGRCTNCMQCLSFCLFDVYGVSTDSKIKVQKAQNCKTDCPACSRVCPEVAILFPKYKAGPINGDEVKAEDLQREKMKVDISALLGGDIYAALRQRSEGAKVRFAKERDEKRALEERKKCLAKLQEALDIPQELMNMLPSAEQIQAKTAAAMAQAAE
ncbi:MAG TPA: ferredoxin family protein [Tepidisphaeraceae bacterium]